VPRPRVSLDTHLGDTIPRKELRYVQGHKTIERSSAGSGKKTTAGKPIAHICFPLRLLSSGNTPVLFYFLCIIPLSRQKPSPRDPCFRRGRLGPAPAGLWRAGVQQRERLQERPVDSCGQPLNELHSYRKTHCLNTRLCSGARLVKKATAKPSVIAGSNSV
jgi:hypothetical protein